MAIALTELVAPAHTALVLQEVQNGVVGDPSVLPELAQAAATTQLVEHCAALAHRAREVGARVFHCTAENRGDGVGGNRNARLFAGVRKAALQLAPGSVAVRPPEAIGVAERDVVLPRYQGLGPFAGTQLDAMLRNEGVTTVVGVGVSVNIGVTNLVFDAVNRGYQVVVPTDAIAGVPAAYARDVVEHTLGFVATLTTTEAVLEAWG